MSNPGQENVFDYNDEKSSDKLVRKAKEAPLMIGGIIGLVGAVGYGAYAFKNRGKMSPSIYLMQLRVVAQSAVIGALTLGIIGSIAQKLLYPKEKKEH